MKSKLTVVIIVVAVVICVLGGGAFAYYSFVAPSIPPEKTLADGLAAMQKIRSFSFDTSIAGRGSNLNAQVPDANFTVALNGSVDFRNPQNTLLESRLFSNFKSENDKGSGSLSLDAGIRHVQRTLYLNLEKFVASYDSNDSSSQNIKTSLQFAQGLAPALLNKWIKIDSTSYSAKSDWSAEDKKDLHDYIFGLSYAKEIDGSGSAKINGVDTRHIKIVVQHGPELVVLAKKIGVRNGLSAQDIKNLESRLNVWIADPNQKMDLELWIGKNDSLIYKIEVNSPELTDPESGATIALKLEALLSNHDKPVTVTVPSGAVTIEQVMQKMFGF